MLLQEIDSRKAKVIKATFSFQFYVLLSVCLNLISKQQVLVLFTILPDIKLRIMFLSSYIISWHSGRWLSSHFPVSLSYIPAPVQSPNLSCAQQQPVAHSQLPRPMVEDITELSLVEQTLGLTDWITDRLAKNVGMRIKSIDLIDWLANWWIVCGCIAGILHYVVFQLRYTRGFVGIRMGQTGSKKLAGGNQLVQIKLPVVIYWVDHRSFGFIKIKWKASFCSWINRSNYLECNSGYI